MTSQSNQTNTDTKPDVLLTDQDAEIRAERGPNDTIDVIFDDTVLRVSKSDGSTLKKQLTDTLEAICADVSDKPVLQLARTNSTIRLDKHPYHLKSEYGCQYSNQASAGITELNLVEKTWEPTWEDRFDWWLKGDRSNRMEIESYLNTFICNRCASALQHWHTQRKIFLGRLAEKINIETIDSSSFSTQTSAETACSICATPKSGIAEFDTTSTVYDIEGPFLLCPTCRDLLIEADSNSEIPQKPLSAHPNKTKNITPGTPITDPKFTPGTSEDSISEKPLKTLSKDEFVAIVEQFEGVSTGTAERLYENGFTEIPNLQSVPKTNLKDITFVGKATAEAIRTGAKLYLDNYHHKLDSNDLPPDQATLTSLL
ncbi:helix-hairpin-helix domain-containing protein [Salinibaculum rarum]|uniref:helix-hairpin-helix domain-containing protein n=1 Tax=Salinibaculum rarum TaxID=3058903 RepID=UPI00265F0535|nr:helix-hairpin-helix domain-containing protein [Salinibaculum sp. KK48]